jgi:hypothetical protein
LDRADKDKLPRVELDTGLSHDLVEREAATEMAERQTIGLGNVKNVIGSEQASRPGHVIDDNGRIAGNIFRHVP